MKMASILCGEASTTSRIALLAIFLFVIASASGSLRADNSATHRIEVSLTGMHPRGAAWDGTDTHVVVFRLSLSSAPELRLLLITPNTARFVGEPEEKSGSPCPDAERCVFSVRNLPEESPFALVVLDDDSQTEAADKVSHGVDRVRSYVSDLAAKFDFERSEIPALPKESEKTIAGLLRLGGSKHDLVAVQIFLPTGHTSQGEIDAISVKVRTLVKEIADSWSTKALSRVSGQIPARPLEECLWPAPACDATYAVIEFEDMSEY